MKAHIILPPVEVEAGQRRCPEACPAFHFRAARATCDAYSVQLDFDSSVEPAPERDYKRCAACLAAEVAVPEPAPAMNYCEGCTELVPIDDLAPGLRLGSGPYCSKCREE